MAEVTGLGVRRITREPNPILFELAGAAYLASTVRGEPPAVYGLLPAAFRQLRETAPMDESRPCVESYRRRTEIEVWMPTL